MAELKWPNGREHCVPAWLVIPLSQKQEYQWPHKKDIYLPKIK